MPPKKQLREGSTIRDYDRFKEYLHKMHTRAVDVMNSLEDNILETIDKYFNKYYRSSQQHYWSITKLYIHAMYIPMFLLIGYKYFKNLVYIDTHAGPGLAKIGRHEKDIILGSPLIALYWPGIIARQLARYRKISSGFTKYYYIEKDRDTYSILRRLVRLAPNSKSINLIYGDSNNNLTSLSISGRSLIYMFSDPYGNFEAQLRYESLVGFLRRRRGDLVMSIFAKNLARGLSGIKDRAQRERQIETLFGPGICNGKRCTGARQLCSAERISENAILGAYMCLAEDIGFRRVEIVPVRFPRGVLYYMLIATKASGKHIDGFIEYITSKMPRRYDTLRNLWLQATGREESLDHFISYEEEN